MSVTFLEPSFCLQSCKLTMSWEAKWNVAQQGNKLDIACVLIKFAVNEMAVRPLPC